MRRHRWFSNQYMCALDIYLMAVISSSYGIIMYHAINAPGHGKIFFDEINSMEKC